MAKSRKRQDPDILWQIERCDAEQDPWLAADLLLKASEEIERLRESSELEEFIDTSSLRMDFEDSRGRGEL